jgi:hypothetical protein
MNSGLINYLLTEHPNTSSIYEGVYAADTFAYIAQTPVFIACYKRPCAFVVNTDPLVKPGQHWVGFFYPRIGPVEYFDSYGLPPLFVSDFKKIIDEVGCYYNPKLIQHPFTTVCGQHVLHFIIKRCKGYMMSEIIDCFDENDPLNNDRKVNDFFRKEFKIALPLVNENFLKYQFLRKKDNVSKQRKGSKRERQWIQ